MASEAREINPVIQRLNDIAAIGRPSIWMVSLLPYYTGYLLARHDFFPAKWDFAHLHGPVTGALVFGPILWLAVLAINDAIDLPGDLLNSRKEDSPLTSGRISSRQATQLAYGCAGLALLLSATVGLELTLLAAGFLVLGWLYSVPPIRLKDRPGWDVGANAIAIGGFALLAGWAVTAPLADFPWIMVAEGILVTTAVYIPTTLADFDADVEAGYKTIAVRLGRRHTHFVGLAAMAASCGIAITLAAIDFVIPHRMLWIQVVAGAFIVAVYHLVLGRAREWPEIVRGIVIVSWLFMMLNGLFALMYVGWV